MAKIISISNQKGGVGKTTTSVNLASSLARLGKKILLIDVDYQANATTNLGVNRAELYASVADIFLRKLTVEEVIISTNHNIDLLPSRFELSEVEKSLILIEDRDFILANALENIESNYDYILIDCPPSLGIITSNALIASDSVLIPVQCEFLAMDGLTQLLNTIRIIQNKQKYGERKLTIEGVLLTMLDTRSNVGYEVINEVKLYFREKVFETIIPRNVKVAVSPSYGMPVTEYSPTSKGAQSYRNLAREVLDNNEEE
jgi:chromosome partitioning protein